MPKITRIQHKNCRGGGFFIDRPNGYPEYSFVHFTDGIETRIDGKAVLLPPHTCIIWRPHTPQFFTSATPVSHDWFHFVGNVEPLFAELGLPVDCWLQPHRWFFISEIMEELQDEFFSKRPDRRLLMKLKAHELFLKLARSLRDVPDDPVSERLRALRAKMLTTPTHPWTVEEMAAKLSLSPSRFHTLYRTLYGTSPIDDLIRARMDMAVYELLSTDQSVAQIAETLGYRNITHFSRQFKQFVGLSPRQYRKTKKE